MAFGERDDELWGVLKPTFRPRVSGDPNIKYAKHLLNQTGAFKPAAYAGPPYADSRAVLAHVVRKAPEVLMKVTGRKKGADHLGAHLSYIGRNGEIAIETRDGEIITEKGEIQQIAQEWSDPLYWRQRATVSVAGLRYVLDGLTSHGTDLKIVEHYTDTGGATDHVFALCAMLGFRFCPRLRDFPDRRLAPIAPVTAYPSITPLLGKRSRVA